MFNINSKRRKIKMEIIQLIMDYGVDTLVIALCTVVFTGLFKIPIKKLADKTKNSKKITRFVTFLPMVFGFGLTVLSTYLLKKQLNFNKAFYVQWVSSVSLSLAIYAFGDKFVPSEKKILSEAEIEANKAAVEKLKSKIVDTAIDSESTTDSKVATQFIKETESGRIANNKKIILSNNKSIK